MLLASLTVLDHQRLDYCTEWCWHFHEHDSRSILNYHAALLRLGRFVISQPSVEVYCSKLIGKAMVVARLSSRTKLERAHKRLVIEVGSSSTTSRHLISSSPFPNFLKVFYEAFTCLLARYHSIDLRQVVNGSHRSMSQLLWWRIAHLYIPAFEKLYSVLNPNSSWFNSICSWWSTFATGFYGDLIQDICNWEL